MSLFGKNVQNVCVLREGIFENLTNFWIVKASSLAIIGACGNCWYPDYISFLRPLAELGKHF